MEESNVQEISEDLKVEILSRLPVRSLMRLKCINKTIHALITNPVFIWKHLKDSDDDNAKLIISDFYLYRNYPLFAFFHDKTLSDVSYEDLGHHVPEIHRPSYLTPLGPFDGLFWFNVQTTYQMILWNLATREYRLLPKVRTKLPRRAEIYNFNVGFQLDPVRHDYKLIILRHFMVNNYFTSLIQRFSQVHIYTLSRDYWREFEGNELSNYNSLESSISDRSINIDGVCYWLADTYDYSRVILSFHMDEEVFREINPPFIPYDSWSCLGISENYLSLLIFDTMENCFDMWVMKKGFGNSWTKQATVGPLLSIKGPINLWKNGAFFVRSLTRQLLLYDPVNDETRMDFKFFAEWLDVHKYKESLIILNPEDNVSDFTDIPWNILGVVVDSDFS